ncbi:hypothetical protein Pan216_10970 [Planctomycetes bacterium Pan216]|uniref:Sulfatase n=1 Tax=Kolteria novifilia TaxID=2527975 RepID=A0A518AZT8_9BACT|nr:hypothetical protein Pan216_10970 [Planctomycetes bacterium Pan216]
MEPTLDRRELLARSAGVAGAVALNAMSRGELLAGERQGGTPNPLAPKAPHHEARAKHVIMLYMSGGYSHVDTFDPKQQLIDKHDTSMGKPPAKDVSMGEGVERFLKAPLWKFRPNAHCGTEVSDLFPNIRGIMHEAALIRSMYCDHRDHGEATLQLHTGSTTVAMPGLGAWLSYGLGTFNENLPSHVVISEHLPYTGAQPWDTTFLPAHHRGIRIVPGSRPLPNLKPRTPSQLQELELGMLARLNRNHADQRGREGQLLGRQASFDMAKNLQDAAPAALDLRGETKETLKLYGAEAGDRTSYAAQCIMARRLVERGVRFVEIIDSVGACRDNWDAAHRDIASHAKYAKRVDRPIAALVEDLKRRGLLDQTLLIFCTEFGRSPWAQDGKGTKSRTHHPDAFSCWLAGGGVKPGIVHGKTDEIGNRVVENGVHVHDFHATILHIMGLDHTRLTFRHAGRDFRLTDVHGHVAEEVLS